MFRGRPHRGDYPRPYGPPPGITSRAPHHGHSPPGPYRQDRERHGYHHGYPEDYRRSPPRRRYSSPGSSSFRGPSGEFRGNGPPPREHSSKRLTPSPPRGDVPIDHSLVITVGNELTGSQALRSSRNAEHHYDRDHHAGDSRYKHPSDRRPGYEPGPEERYRRRSPSRGRSRPRSRSRSRGRGRSRSRSRSRGKSRGRSLSRGRSRGRSKSRARSRSRSRSRSRGRSRARSRARSRLREKSRSRSGSSSSSSGGRSPRTAIKAKSGEFRELEMARRRKELEDMLTAPTKSILKKRVDSEDSPAAQQSCDSPVGGSGENPSSSLSREAERFLSAVSKGMESGLFASMLGDVAEQPHDQSAQAVTHGLSLEQYQEILRVVKQETDAGGTGQFLLPHEQVRQDASGFSRIFGAMGNAPDPPQKKKSFTDIEDEEKFLYGDGDEDEGDKGKVPAQTHSAAQARASQLHSQPELSLYGESQPEISKYHDSQLAMAQYQGSKPDVTEYPGGREFVQRCLSQAGVGHDLLSEAYSGVTDSPYRHGSAASEDRLDARLLRGSHQQAQPDVRYLHRGQPSAAAAQNNGDQTGDAQEQNQPPKYPPGLDPLEAKEREEVVEYEKIQDLLKTIGLDLGVAEISKMAARTQERLHGKKPPTASSRRAERLQERRATSGSWNRRKSHSSTSSSSSSSSRSRSRDRGRGRSRGRSRKRSPDSEGRSVPSRPSRQVSLGESRTDGGRSELEVKVGDKNWGIPVLGKAAGQPRVTVSINPPSSLPSIPPPATTMGAHTIQTMSGYQSQAPAYPIPPPNYPPPGYGQYEGYMPYMPPGWPMYPPPTLLPPQSPVEDVSGSSASIRPYLRVIETVATEGKDLRSSQTASTASKPNSQDVYTSQTAKVELSQEQQLAEEKNNASQKEKVIEEKEQLKKERDVRMKKKEYLMKELERLRKQQGELLRKKRRERDGHKDPLLAELGRLQEEVMAQISRLRKEHVAAEQQRAELDKVALILGMHGSDKHRKAGRASGEQGPPPAEKTPGKPPAATPPSSASAAPAKGEPALRSSPEKQKPKGEHGARSLEKCVELYEYYDSGNHWCKNCNTVCGSMFDFFTHLHSKSHRKTLDPYDRPWASDSSSKEKKRTPGEKVVRPAKGCEFLVPVMGFFCQLCEEFFGDQICAEEHVTCHKHNEKYKKRMEEYPLYEQRRNLDRQAGLSVSMDSRERKHNDLKRRLETESMETEEDRPSSPGDEPPPSHRDRKPHSSRDEKPVSQKEEMSSSHREEKEPAHRDDQASGHRDEKRASVRKEKEARKRSPVREVKSEPQKHEEPAVEKPANIPKVFCGPSPSILAKVRKRNEEAVKHSASTSAFGKFSWKKPEKEKEKEYDFDEEEKAKEEDDEEDDDDDGEDHEEGKSTFAKAKSIAIKLSGKTIIPPSNAWVPFASAQPAPATKIRPTLTAPMMVLRKSSTTASTKPAALNSFLSTKPSGGNNGKPLPVVKKAVKKDTMLTPDLISKAFGGEEVVLKTAEVPAKTTPASGKEEKKPSPVITKLPAKTKAVVRPPVPAPPPPPPGMRLMSLESDVAAPGVPESEQTMAVLVCPPPLVHMTISESSKNEKPKSSLAAAKAQDLYDIFYSSGTKTGPDLLAGAKQPKSGETPKSKDSVASAPKTESKSDMDVVKEQTSEGSVDVQPEEQTLEIPNLDKDAPCPQLDIGDLDMFTFNFE